MARNGGRRRRRPAVSHSAGGAQGSSDAPPSMSGPLGGLRVIDFGQYIAGPLAAMLLADQGADVVHVDPPGGPRWQTPANDAWTRGKQLMQLDLHIAPDRARARELIASADVVIENFRPGV